MRVTYAVLAALTAALTVVPTTAPATASPRVVQSAPGRTPNHTPRHAPVCQGHRATLVGHPGQTRLVGTRRADVIVSDGALRVDARGGDDVVCLTGQGSVDVSAGAGDDSVVASAVTGFGGIEKTVVQAWLGPGRDRFVGSKSRAHGCCEDVSQPRDVVHAEGGGADSIFTGSGDDTVSAGGLNGTRDHDQVHLGRDDDTMIATLDPSTTWSGETGYDELRIDAPYHPARDTGHAWAWDVTRGGIYRDGVLHVRMDTFDDFGVPSWMLDDFSFVGGDKRDDLSFTVSDPRDDIAVDLGAGVGVISAGLAMAPHSLQLTGSYGDEFDPYGVPVGTKAPRASYAGVDLGAGTISLGSPTVQVGTITGFNSVTTHGYARVSLTGNDHRNELSAEGTCDATLVGGAGDDVLRGAGSEEYHPTLCRSGGTHFDGGPGVDALWGTPGDDTMSGGTGNDYMYGNTGDDDLIGDSGYDYAYADAGTDHCVAEIIRSCESGSGTPG